MTGGAEPLSTDTPGPADPADDTDPTEAAGTAELAEASDQAGAAGTGAGEVTTVLAADGAADPAESAADPAEAPADPAEAPADPAEDAAKPDESTADLAESPAEPAGEPAKPAESAADPNEGSGTTPAVVDQDAAGTDQTEVLAPDSDRTEVLDVAAVAGGGGVGTFLDETPAEKGGSRAKWVWTGVGVLLVLLGGAYVGGVLWSADRTPPNATVSGVDVGGLSSAQAVATLEDTLGVRASEPLPVTVGEISATIVPDQAGLSYDPEASVAQITGQSWDPRVVWERLTGTADVEAVTSVDTDTLTAELTDAASFVAVEPQDAAIAFANGTAVVTDPVDGSGLDIPGSVDLISAEWLTASEPLELPVAAVSPELDQAAVDAAMADIVDPLLSAPVTLQAGDVTGTIEPGTLTDLAAIVGVDGKFELELDGPRVVEVVEEALPEVGAAAKDATYELVDGRPRIVPAVTGAAIDPEQVVAAVTTAAVEPTGRVATIELVTAEPEFTTADAEALGELQVIGEYSTKMPYDPPRTENLVVAARRINGVVVKPGEQFSLLRHVAPITVANGYNNSLCVGEGVVRECAGGGVSQLSTTSFNAGFEAGMLDIQHKPHSRWFDRYPPGREATVSDPGLDMVWENNTPYPVVVQAGASSESTWVKLWSKPYWDVTISSGDRYNYTSSQTIYNTQPQCTPESGGRQGFSIRVHRTVSHDGVEDEAASGTLTWTYSAWPKVVCGPKPDDA